MSEFTEHPPVPKVLQEALKDYPEVSSRLQQALKRTGLRPGMSRAQRTDQFEAAIGLLEDCLDHFMSLAAAEIGSAEAMGDATLIAMAKEKEMLMSGCRHDVGVRELSEFFRCRWGQD